MEGSTQRLVYSIYEWGGGLGFGVTTKIQEIRKLKLVNPCLRHYWTMLWYYWNVLANLRSFADIHEDLRTLKVITKNKWDILYHFERYCARYQVRK